MRCTSFPDYDPTVFLDMMYALQMYRGRTFNGEEESIVLFHHYDSLIQDGNRKQLDPFPHKVMVKSME